MNNKDHDDIKRTLYHFDATNVGKPTPWDGENESEFKMWKERLATYMSTAGDKA